MIDAKSARGLISLGATLIAVASNAGAESSATVVQGITSADALGITTADALGITSADALGITTADALGITSADALGITTADALGITSADALGITTADALGITSADALAITSVDNHVLTGPVDSIDAVNGVFESLGQVVMASQSMLSSMSVGDYVSVSGTIVSSGWLYADDVSVSAQRYVPGATEVYVAGMLSSIDQSVGTVEMGNLTINYTSSLGTSNPPSALMWSFRGIRPTDDGVLLSDRSGAIR